MVSKEELESMIRRIVGESLRSGSSHEHASIDRHYAECPDCGTRNPRFNPDLVCTNCDMPVYRDDPECPWCHNSNNARPLTKEDVARFYTRRLR